MVIRLHIKKRHLKKLAKQAGCPEMDPRDLFDMALEIGIRTLTAATRGESGKA